jgi:hypothetical protein
MAWFKTHGWRVLLAAAVLAIAFWASNEHGVPKNLPAPALGWRLLFHVERAVVLLTAIGAVLLVGWRALHGEFPIKFGQLEYAAKETADKTDSLTGVFEQRLQLVEGLIGIADPAPKE